MKNNSLKNTINIFGGGILNICFLVLIPLFSAWWVFLPLALIAAILWGRNYSAILAGFLLDLVYSGQIRQLPMLTISAILISAVSVVFRDKVRA